MGVPPAHLRAASILGCLNIGVLGITYLPQRAMNTTSSGSGDAMNTSSALVALQAAATANETAVRIQHIANATLSGATVAANDSAQHQVRLASKAARNRSFFGRKNETKAVRSTSGGGSAAAGTSSGSGGGNSSGSGSSSSSMTANSSTNTTTATFTSIASTSSLAPSNFVASKLEPGLGKPSWYEAVGDILALSVAVGWITLWIHEIRLRMHAQK